jgi:FtsH-binding integral membrane protein
VRKVYTILTFQIIVTAGVSAISFFSEGYKKWIQSHQAVVWISVRRIYTQHPLSKASGRETS